MIQRPARRPWYQSNFAFNLAGGLFLFAAFPPLGWWPLAWIAPWYWFALIDRKLQEIPLADPAPGGSRWRRLFSKLDYPAWLAATLSWLLLLQGLRLAHWGTHFGWLAISMYLAVYLPVFLAWTTQLMRRSGLPLGLAAAITWTVLELIRGHLITGFSMGLLAHTQARQPYLIQIADFSGAYGVSFLIILVSGCIYRVGPWNPQQPKRWALVPAGAALLLLAATITYGAWAQRDDPAEDTASTLNVGLIQGSIDTQFGEAATPDDRIFDLYNYLTLQLRIDHPEMDLVIWPESMFSFQAPELLMDQDSLPPPDIPLDRAEFLRRAQNHNERFYQHTTNFARSVNRSAVGGPEQDLDIHFILGTNCWQLPPQEKHFNSALLVNPAGEITNRYHKMHRVMFGEYIPGGNWFPWLYRFSPIGTGLSPGQQPIAFQTKNWTLVPNICFESTVPHLIRHQLQYLRSQGTNPDALVTITNDGWFWGSSMLDLHFLCGIFRAVEHRLPMLIAANTGISAWIDHHGHPRAVGPRRQPGQREDGVVLAQLYKKPPGHSWYPWYGDWPWTLLGLVALLVAYWPQKRTSLP
ncbi:MAG: apolipoprotein N-acyltransferase [Pirellulaceae bacterium]|nr:apolipoprotein N-acyltransferase [Pirellulaceae bacterium]